MTTGIASDLSAFLLLVDRLTALAVVLVVFLPRRKATIHFAAAPLRRGTPGENPMEQMSLKDVAALLGVKAYRIEYLLCHGLVPEPKLRISGRRVFGPEDVANFEGPLREEDAEGEEGHGEAQVETAGL